MAKAFIILNDEKEGLIRVSTLMQLGKDEGEYHPLKRIVESILLTLSETVGDRVEVSEEENQQALAEVLQLAGVTGNEVH